MARSRICLTIVVVAFTVLAVKTARSDPPDAFTALPAAGANAHIEPMVLEGEQEGSGTANVSPGPTSPPDGQSNTWVGSTAACDSDTCAGKWVGGADFLLVRAHFSEATAYVKGTQGAASLDVTAQPLDFTYTPSFRMFAGYQFAGTQTEFRFTYTRLTSDAENSLANPGPGHFAVDPFGNVVGTVVVVDPDSARFGQPIVGGNRIAADAAAHVNIFDLDLIRPLVFSCGQWEWKYSAGVRIADVHQSYDSAIYQSGAFFSGGDYIASFTGAGPRLGLQVQRQFGELHQFSIFADSAASLLVGEYEMNFAQVTTAPPFQAGQTTDEVRLLPVAEIEVGAGWSPVSWMNLSAGWLFQAWFDLGGSGGNFGNFYTVTENSNIMAFEGLFLRAEARF